MASSKNGFFSRNCFVILVILFSFKRTFCLLGLFRPKQQLASAKDCNLRTACSLNMSDLLGHFISFFKWFWVSHTFVCFVFHKRWESCEGGVWCKSVCFDQLSFFFLLPTKSRIAAKISMIFLFCFSSVGLVVFVLNVFSLFRLGFVSCSK